MIALPFRQFDVNARRARIDFELRHGPFTRCLDTAAAPMFMQIDALKHLSTALALTAAEYWPRWFDGNGEIYAIPAYKEHSNALS